MNPPTKSKSTKLLYLTIIPWLLACSFGFSILMKYETTPGQSFAISSTWPKTQIKYNKNLPTLLMFVHSRCSCSEASLDELSKIISINKDKIDARVYFYVPRNSDENWTQSKNWIKAKAIAGVYVFEDTDGRIANEFGAKTSGHTFIYNTSGDLIFNGGITFKRGTTGKNSGSEAVKQYINEAKVEINQTAVFGCEF